MTDRASQGPGSKWIEDALDRVADLPEPEQNAALERLCAARPDQADELRARYATFRGLLDATAFADRRDGHAPVPARASARTRATASEPGKRRVATDQVVRRRPGGAPAPASTPRTMHRWRQLLQRTRGTAIAAGTVLACLAAGLVVSLVFYVDAAHARDRLDPVVLRGLEREAENELWPVHPDLAPRLEHWLERAAGLRERIGVQRANLGAVERRGRPGAAGLVFDAPADAAAHAELSRLMADFDRFFAPAATASNVAGVTARLALARSLRERTVDAHRRAWDDARAAIRSADGVSASALYRGLDLVPQLGLVPLGPDPVSKLWEFYHLDSGEPGAPLPSRDPPGGRITMRPEFGFVLVLLPGGKFAMGSAEVDDPRRGHRDEAPRHDVTLAPFFLSKFECTQAQWKRVFDGQTPSHYGPASVRHEDVPTPTWVHPVEQVLWDEVVAVGRRLGLQLPTEAQWECACRAGSTAAYPWGDDKAEMQHHGNVADAFAARFGTAWPGFEPWEDGFLVHAPVGSLAPNGFGLHDMLGNVAELCADEQLSYTNLVRPGDGLRLGNTPEGRTNRVSRGGSWMSDCSFARCAVRRAVPVRATSDLVGFRPARALDAADGRPAAPR